MEGDGLRHIGAGLLLALGVLGSVSSAFGIWHCGDIPLQSSPQAIITDPVSRDFWIALSSSQLIRIDEATAQTAITELAAPATQLAIDPANRLLYAIHPLPGLLTILEVDTGDSILINVGDSPVAVTTDPIRNAAYVACQGDSSIQIIINKTAGATVRCIGSPAALAVDPHSGYIFAALPGENLVLKVDPSTLDTTYYLTGRNPQSLEIDPVKGEVYIATAADSSVDVLAIDIDSLFSIPLDGSPLDLAVNPETQNLFVTTPNGLIIVDTQSLSTTGVDLPGAPGYVTIDALSDRAFVTLSALRMLVEVSAGSDTLVTSIPGTPSDLILNPITNKAYVLTSDPDQVGVFEAANYSGTRIPAGGGPGPVAINMENHKVYTPNWFTANVTVIDGYTNSTSTIKVADGPNGLTIDPMTEDVYVLCAWANKMTIIRSNGDTLTVPIGSYGHGIELNPNTRKVYVANRYSRDMTIIDVESLDTTLVRTGAYPCDVAINLETNTVYVPNRTSWTLTVVDGALLTTRFPKVGPGPTQVHVNPVTNKIFSVDSNKRTISVIDGETLERVVVPVGTTPRALSINTNTNTFYVSSGLDGEITVVDGVTYERRPVRCIEGLFGVKADQYLDKVYTASWDYPYAFVIDGNFLNALRIPVGEEPHGIAYDPVLEKLYVSNHGRNSVEVIKLREKIQPRLIVTIDSLPGDTTYTRTPTLTGTASSLLSLIHI